MRFQNLALLILALSAALSSSQSRADYGFKIGYISEYGEYAKPYARGEAAKEGQGVLYMGRYSNRVASTENGPENPWSFSAEGNLADTLKPFVHRYVAIRYETDTKYISSPTGTRILAIDEIDPTIDAGYCVPQYAPNGMSQADKDYAKKYEKQVIGTMDGRIVDVHVGSFGRYYLEFQKGDKGSDFYTFRVEDNFDFYGCLHNWLLSGHTVTIAYRVEGAFSHFNTVIAVRRSGSPISHPAPPPPAAAPVAVPKAVKPPAVQNADHPFDF